MEETLRDRVALVSGYADYDDGFGHGGGGGVVVVMYGCEE